MKPASLRLLLALLGILLCSTAAADVTSPWELDPDFAGSGYDYQYAEGRLVIDTRIAIDRSRSFPVPVVAVWSTDAQGDDPRIELFRYSAAGDRLTWVANSVPGSNEQRLRVPKFETSGGILTPDRLVDLKITPDGQIAVLVDGPWLAAMEGLRSTALFVVNSDGTHVGANLNAGWKEISNAVPEPDSFGAGMQFTSSGDLMIANAHTAIGGNGGYQYINLHRFAMQPGQAPTRVTAWASSGKKTYARSKCGQSGAYICALRPTALAMEPSGNHFYIGGSTPWADGNPDSAGRDLFLLKVRESDGNVVSSYADNGWFRPQISGFQNWAQSVRGIQFMRYGSQWMPLVLSTMPRACGRGWMVMTLNESGGSTIVRTWVHGGSNSGTDCNSADARDLVFVGEPDDANAQLAVVGRHQSERTGTIRRHSAFIRMLNPRNLPAGNTEDDQLVLQGSFTGLLRWGLDSAVYFPYFDEQLILASGVRYASGQDDASVIARLRGGDQIFRNGFDPDLPPMRGQQ